MKTALCTSAALALLVFLGAGCQNPTPRTEKTDQPFNEALISHYNDAAVDNAIVQQRTIYPYCFVNNSAQLNDLGEYHVGVLTDHFRSNPGTLSLWKGDTPDELYSERRDAVMTLLDEAGVELNAMTVTDSMPGGRAATSDETLKAYDREGDN